MTPERYQQINALVDALLEIPVDQRLDFLDQNCAGNQDLRMQVNQLLVAHDSSSGFLEAPLLDLIARDLAALPNRTDLAGRMIHHYTVVSRLGAGGMGEVWLAKDAQLTRDVAIKLLSPIFARDPYHVRRFQQEARAASTLNHPNIVTIYEIGKVEGVDFIAQEFVHGQTLRQLVAKGPLPLLTALDISDQVAAALAAAHRAGTIHRDIKPENVMIRPDGLVKVLDWGIARLTERQQALDDPPLHDDSSVRTGFVLGTMKYMSPEQARGLNVDLRSDLFSLGVVLYEMVTGVAPFRGSVPTEILTAILDHEPEPLSHHLAEAPGELERIIRLCLEKDPTTRYPGAVELRTDLDRLRRRMESRESISTIDKPPAAVAASSKPKNSRGPILLALGAILAILIAAGTFITVDRRNPSSFLNSMKISRVATRGEVADAAISPDGDHVAYVVDEDQGQSLWMKQLATNTDTEVRPPEQGEHLGLTFSSDGSYLYYRRRVDNGIFALYRLGMLGGEPVQVEANVNVSGIAFAPGGRQFAFFRTEPSQHETSLLVANADGTGERTIATRRRPNYFGRYSLAWSPDGRWIACFAGNGRSHGGESFHLIKVRVSNGGEQTITAHSWRWGGSIVWSANNALFFDTTDQVDDGYQIWTVSLKNGQISRLTNDLNNYTRLSLTSDSKTLLAMQTQKSADIWVAPAGDSSRAVQITFGNILALGAIAWTPDGRIVYSAQEGDSRNIWIMDAHGGASKQLTHGSDNKMETAVTHDGKYVVYQSEAKIWRSDLESGAALQLTNGAHDVHPEPTADSRFVIYASFTNWSPGIGGKPTLWKVPINGGKPSQLSALPASLPKVSPDGKLVAFEYFPEVDPQLSRQLVGLMNSQGGDLKNVFDRLPAMASDPFWEPDGKALQFVVLNKHVGNVWRQPLSGAPAAQVTNFNTGRLVTFAWSQDGRQLAMVRGKTTHDIVLITNFK